MPKASEAVLAGVLWLHLGEKAEIRAENAKFGAGLKYSAPKSRK